MTTRKQRTAAFVCNSFLVLATTAHASDQQPSEPIFASAAVRVHQASPIERMHDSNTVSLPDSASTMTRKAALQAPQIPLNPAAAPFVEKYIRQNNDVLGKVAQRGKGVFRIMEPILLRYGLPVELKYLAVVESDLERTAVSRVGAAGPWQLMPVTARELGLKVTKKSDERKHYAKSTTAAAKYLRDLFNEYGDWLLVIAAYNSGPGVVNKAIRHSGSRNFWKLQHLLPAETRGHVKRFIGTHYYFEETGGETTLTKAEYTAYSNAVAQFMAAAPNAAKVALQEKIKPLSSESPANDEPCSETGAMPMLHGEEK